MKTIKVAVIGYGHLGKWHCQKVESFPLYAELRYIVEKNPTNQKMAKEAHPKAMIVDDIEKCIHDIDAGIVVTPTSLHFGQVEYLLKNNKHVFCEKPVTETTNEASLLKDLLKEKDLILQVGHSERFHSAWSMKNLYEDYFRPPAQITLKRVAPFKGRATDVDVVADLMIHDLDLLVYLFQEIPISVDAIGFKMRTDKFDYVSANFQFTSGCRANIVVGRNQPREIRELEIANQHGTLLFDLMKNEVVESSAKFEAPHFTKTIPYEKRDHLMLEHKHFYESITNKIPPIVSIHDGLIAVNLIDKVLESARQKVEVKI